MRRDMAKVVTEAPRSGHGNPSKKWGRRLNKDDYHSDDHGPSRAPIAAHRQYGWNAREFSDLLGPLRRYLRKQVGRPVGTRCGSKITRTLDSRSLTGQHIFDHIRWEVEQHARLGADGRLYHSGRLGARGYWVVFTSIRSRGFSVARWGLSLDSADRFWKARRRFECLAFALPLRLTSDAIASMACTSGSVGSVAGSSTPTGWSPERLVRVVTRTDGREVPIYATAPHERVARNKRASARFARLDGCWHETLWPGRASRRSAHTQEAGEMTATSRCNANTKRRSSRPPEKRPEHGTHSRTR